MSSDEKRAVGIVLALADRLLGTVGGEIEWSGPTSDVAIDQPTLEIIDLYVIPALKHRGVTAADRRTALALIARSAVVLDRQVAASSLIERADRSQFIRRETVEAVPIDEASNVLLEDIRKRAAPYLKSLSIDVGSLLEAILDQLIAEAGGLVESP